MAKAKSAADGKPTDRTDRATRTTRTTRTSRNLFVVKGDPTWLAWVDGLAAHLKLKRVTLVAHALKELAIQHGYEPPPVRWERLADPEPESSAVERPKPTAKKKRKNL